MKEPESEARIVIRSAQRAPEEGRFLTVFTFSLLRTSNAHICRCSKSGGKKVTGIVGFG